VGFEKQVSLHNRDRTWMRADVQDMLNMLRPVSELSEQTPARGPADGAHTELRYTHLHC